jgi:predicted enzyme involved in methoxymalonyl-ACP biosynthesis
VLDVLTGGRHGPETRHLVSWRINWKSKSENIKSLAAELGLGLDVSYLSMTTRWIARMSDAKCPSVLTLQTPQDGSFDSLVS